MWCKVVQVLSIPYAGRRSFVGLKFEDSNSHSNSELHTRQNRGTIPNSSRRHILNRKYEFEHEHVLLSKIPTAHEIKRHEENRVAFAWYFQ